MEVTTKARKWGNSLGVIIPKDVTGNLDIKENDELQVTINKAGVSDVLKKSFGLCKDEKRSAQEIKDELRRTLWSKKY